MQEGGPSRRRLRVGILFGGRSAEHEVSLQSARSVLSALDASKYDPVLIGIDKSGQWHLQDKGKALLADTSPRAYLQASSENEVALLPRGESNRIVNVNEGADLERLDVVFPILHGPFGEDGTVQGLLKLANIPFVGAGVTGSAVGMDKDVMKRLLRDAGIRVAPFHVYRSGDRRNVDFDAAKAELGLPLFVKPANLGSSVGIAKVSTASEFDRAVANAFEYDTKVICETFIKGREIECAVLGNDDPIASVPGEVLPYREFYSYEAKYLDENGAELIIPADLDDETRGRIQETAVDTFKVLCCSGMARVDLFLTPDGELTVNEINTIPGFTRISMYPKLWGASGIGYTELISRLIELGIERFESERRLRTSYDGQSEHS